MSLISKVDSVYAITIGDIHISLSAIVAMIAGLLVAISMIMFIPNSYQASIITILLATVVSYEINCFEFGKCDILAWAHTILYVIFSFILLFIIYKGRTNPSELNMIMQHPIALFTKISS
jgi:hypothetical protein